MKRPMLLAAILSCVIVVLFYYFPNFSLLLCVFLIPILSYLIFTNKRISAILLLIAVFAVSISTLARLNLFDKINNYDGETYTVKLVATENPENRGEYRIIDTCVLKGGVIPRYSKLSLIDFEKDLSISGGMVFNALIKLESLHNSDYALYRISEGCYAQAEIISLYPANEKNIFFSAIQNVRNYVSDTLFNFLSYDTASTLLAVATGNKNYLSDSFADAIKLSGVSHVMAVSGLHLTIIMNGVFSFVNKIFNNRFLKCFLSIFVVFAIASLCGFTMSIIRAGIMCIISAFAPIFRRDKDTLNSLAATVVFVLIFSPFAVFNIAFQLSTLATFGIVYIAPFFNTVIEEKVNPPFWLMKQISGIINTFSATLMTLPICVYNFKMISLISPITNLLISFSVTLMLLFTTGAIVISLLPLKIILFKPMLFIGGVAAKYTNYIVGCLASLPFAVVKFVSEKSVVTVVLFFIFFIVILLSAMWIYNYLKFKKINSEILSPKKG